MEITTTEPLVPTKPGKSGQAVGQIAKQAVADARVAGAELPKNAQGMAASAIAQGTDPSSVFAALIVPEPVEPADDMPDAPVAEGETAPAADETTTAAEAGYTAASDILSPNAMTSDEAALALLQGTD